MELPKNLFHKYSNVAMAKSQASTFFGHLIPKFTFQALQ
jgi:hypothetical protein